MKNVKKVLSAILTISLLSGFVSLVGCSNASSGASSAPSAAGSAAASSDAGSAGTASSGNSKNYRIVIMPKVVGIDYYNAVKTGVDKASSELKGKVTVEWTGPTDAQVDKQIQMLQTIIPTKPDLIAVAADDTEAIVPVLKQASAAGIKVVTWDGDASFRDFFVNLVDYTEFGNALMDDMAQQIGEKGDIAIITTSFTAPNQAAWIKAIKDRLAEKYPNIKILDSRAVGEDTQKANQCAQDMIKAMPTLKGIIALGCPDVPGAVDAVKQADKVGKVAVVGNGTPNAMKSYLKEGSIKDSLLWDAPAHGYLTVYSAYQLLSAGIKEGTPFQAGSLGTFTPKKDGSSLAVGLPLLTLTKDNVDKYNF